MTSEEAWELYDSDKSLDEKMKRIYMDGYEFGYVNGGKHSLYKDELMPYLIKEGIKLQNENDRLREMLAKGK